MARRLLGALRIHRLRATALCWSTAVLVLAGEHSTDPRRTRLWAAPKTSRLIFVVPTKMRSRTASAYSLAADAVSVESIGGAAMIAYS